MIVGSRDRFEGRAERINEDRITRSIRRSNDPSSQDECGGNRSNGSRIRVWIRQSAEIAQRRILTNFESLEEGHAIGRGLRAATVLECLPHAEGADREESQ